MRICHQRNNHLFYQLILANYYFAHFCEYIIKSFFCFFKSHDISPFYIEFQAVLVYKLFFRKIYMLGILKVYFMEITTVKVQKRTKLALEELKTESESFDVVIAKLISYARKIDLKKKLIDAYKSMGKKDVLVLKEW